MRAFSVKSFCFCSRELVFCVIQHKNKRASKKYALRYTDDPPTLLTGWAFHKMQWALNGEGVLNFIAEEMKNYKPTNVQILLNEKPYFEIEFGNLFCEIRPKEISYFAPRCSIPAFDEQREYFIKQLHKHGVKVSPECTTVEIICLYNGKCPNTGTVHIDPECRA